MFCISKTTWFSRLSGSKSSLFLWKQGVNYWFDTIVNQLFEDLVRGTEQRDGTVALGSSTGYESLGITITSALLQTFEILSWCKQEKRKPRSQDFKPRPAWIKSSGQIKSGSRALPGFK